MSDFDFLNVMDQQVRSGEISDGDWPESGKAILIACKVTQSQKGDKQLEFRLAKEKQHNSQKSWFVTLPDASWKDFRKLMTLRQLYGCVLGPMGLLTDDPNASQVMLGNAVSRLQNGLTKTSILVEYTLLQEEGTYVNQRTGQESKFPPKLVRMDKIDFVPVVQVIEREKKPEGSQPKFLSQSEVPF